MFRSDNTGICRGCIFIMNNESRYYEACRLYGVDNIEYIIYYFYNDNQSNLNELSLCLSLDIKELIKICTILKITNRKIEIHSICDYCGVDIINTPFDFMSSEHHYCSHNCYSKHKKEIIDRGEDSIFYDRVITKCDQCGKAINRTKSRYNRKNRFGEIHNFCSKECYWTYRSNYYVGEKSNRDLINWTPQLHNKMRENLIQRLKNDDRLNSKPQQIVDKILDKLKINYTREYNIKYYSIDNYLNDYNLMIEVMGDYWHASPCRYNELKYGLNQKQLDGIHRDKLKYSYVKNQYNIEILYLWESDILNNSLLCEKLICEYINNNGALDNYNSFNFSLDSNNSLCLNSDLIIPYKDQDIKRYKHLLKQTVN